MPVSSHLSHPRPLHPDRSHLPLRLCYLLLLLLLLCLAPLPCLSARPRQQHNVWYNGLFISGIAVDEASGDVFFSDAAGNRVVHQARNGSVLHVYDQHGFFSPMQLAYHAGKLYVADSSNNRVAVIDVERDTVQYSMASNHLSSVSALTVNSGTGSVVAVDGWGLQTEVWSPDSGLWSHSVDLSNALITPLPNFLSSVTVDSFQPDDGPVWLSDPTQPPLFVINNDLPQDPTVNASTMNPLAVTYFSYDDPDFGLYVLYQAEADGPMQVGQLGVGNSTLLTAPGTGGAAVPFFGWAMFVDSSASMYVSDHGVDAVSSPYGRVVQLAANGSEVSSWSMSDGVAYAFSSVWYDDHTTMGGSCAFWAADSERGVVRVSAEGALLPPFDAAPVDAADGRAARFTGMAKSIPIPLYFDNSTFVLLDTASPTTTKLWRYLPDNHSYELINTTAAQLGANITALAADQEYGIYVGTAHRVIRLYFDGEVDDSFDSSSVGFIEPAGIWVDSALPSAPLLVVDRAYNGTGAVIELDCFTYQNCTWTVLSQTTPPMFRPLSLTVDTTNSRLYVADSNGHVFQIDVSNPPYTQQAVHQAVPAARSIVSMTVSSRGHVYMLDSYSRRLVILSQDTTQWAPGSDCLPPMPPSSLSSTSAPSVVSSLSSSSSRSTSSSTGALSPPAASLWSAAAVVAVVLVGVAATAGIAVCFYMTWKGRQGQTVRTRKEARERLWAADEYEEEADDEDEADEADDDQVEYDQDEYGAVIQPRVVDDNEADADARRYSYYVARYEVMAVVRAARLEQLEDGKQHQAHRSISQQRSFRATQSTAQPFGVLARFSSAATSATSAPHDSTHSSASHASTSSTSADNSGPEESSSSSSPPSASPSTPGLTSPRHIAELRSVWHTLPTVIDSVTDLTILGEGSSGVVYRGVYRGQACVVKLPKSAALTGAAWREWQWHLSLPPHRHLVHFLGALPMSSTSYLVTAYVQQGSLHSLLCSSHAARSTQYSRPYAVMRCMRDMVCVLCHMHSAGVVHRDVSCRNILVDSDGCMVLADLGLAIQLARRDGARGGEVAVDSLQTAVPVRWTSPEALQSSAYSSASDVWSLGVAVWEMTAGGALPYGDTQHSSTAACIRPIVAGQLALHIDERWGRGGGGGGGSRGGGGGGGGKGDGGSGGDSVSGDGSAGTHTTASTQHTLSRAEQQLADRVRRLTHAALQYDVQQRPDSHTMQQAVESEWNEWQAEWASEADELHAEWAAYHAEVQRRLGPPCQHGQLDAP